MTVRSTGIYITFHDITCDSDARDARFAGDLEYGRPIARVVAWQGYKEFPTGVR